MKHLLVLILIICSSQSWVLKTTYREVTFGITKNVVLECIYDYKDNGKPPIIEVVGILINVLRSSDDWATYAKVRENHHNAVLGDHVEPGAIVKGYAGKLNESFLSVKWPLSSSDMTGTYACEIDGYAEDDTFISLMTDSVSIVKSYPSLQSLLSLFRNLTDQTQKALNKSSVINNRVLKEFKTIHENMNTLEGDVNVNNEIVNSISQARGEMSILQSKLQEWDARRNWPHGEYAVLDTKNGCPNPIWFTNGYVKFHSESSKRSSDDRVSNSSHFAEPVFNHSSASKFFFIRTCKHVPDKSGPAWPNGSYCIHRVGGFCPLGFEAGTIALDAEDSPKLSLDQENGPDVTMDANKEYMYFKFCCRQDEAPTTPIYLPVDKSFYLYRYKGVCQEIYDTVVSEEWFQIDTEDVRNGDQNITRIHPDFSPNPARFFLCYYTKL